MGGKQPQTQSQNDRLEGSVSHRPWYELGMMADPILDQTLLFYVAMTWSGQADVGECLETASRVNPSDPDSWPEEWTKTAGRLLETAAPAYWFRCKTIPTKT
jgi:hypothetical protein